MNIKIPFSCIMSPLIGCQLYWTMLINIFSGLIHLDYQVYQLLLANLPFLISVIFLWVTWPLCVDFQEFFYIPDKLLLSSRTRPSSPLLARVKKRVWISCDKSENTTKLKLAKSHVLMGWTLRSLAFMTLAGAEFPTIHVPLHIFPEAYIHMCIRVRKNEK